MHAGYRSVTEGCWEVYTSVSVCPLRPRGQHSQITVDRCCVGYRMSENAELGSRFWPSLNHCGHVGTLGMVLELLTVIPNHWVYMNKIVDGLRYEQIWPLT